MSGFGFGMAWGYGGYGGGLGGYGWGFPAATQILTPPVSEDAKAKPQEEIERNWNVSGWISGGPGYIPGFDKAPPLTIPILWQMRRYAIIAFAHQTITIGPILAGVQSIEMVNEADKDDATVNEILEAATEDVLPIIRKGMEAGFECLNFGFSLQELQWDRRDGRTYPCDLLPILPGEAVMYRDKYRQFAGYQVNEQFRDPRYAFLTVNNPHIDPIFGESRNAFVREEWWRARQSEENADTTERKAAGKQLAIGVPQGLPLYNADGTKISYNHLCTQLANAAARGEPFTYPMMPFDKDEIANNPELAKLPAILISQYDWGNIGPAIDAHLARMTQLDAKIMMGRLRPTREAMEGSSGTKAEAGVHGQVGVTDSEWVAAQYFEQASKQILDRFVVTNWGPQYAGKLAARQAPLSDPQQTFLQDLYKALASGQAPDPTLIAQIDPRAMGKRVEVPLLEEDEVKKKLADQEAKQQAQDDAKNEAMAAGKANSPANGNGNGAVPVKTNGNGKNGARLKLTADVADRLSAYLDAEPVATLELDSAATLTGGEWRTINGAHDPRHPVGQPESKSTKGLEGYRNPSPDHLSGQDVYLWHGSSESGGRRIVEKGVREGSRGTNASADVQHAAQYPEDTGAQTMVLLKASTKDLSVDPNDQIGETVEDGLFPASSRKVSSDFPHGHGSSATVGAHTIKAVFDVSGAGDSAIRALQRGDWKSAFDGGVTRIF